MPLSKIPAVGVDATGTPSSSTFFRGDNTWATAGGITSGTAVASTSGTSIDFTGIPATAKRITVMFSGVSLSGAASFLLQVGSGSVTSSGYISTGNAYQQSNGTTGLSSTTGFVMVFGTAAFTSNGVITINLISGTTYICAHNINLGTTYVANGAGSVTLSGALDRVRITTTNGTDTFDAGLINIMWE